MGAPRTEVAEELLTLEQFERLPEEDEYRIELVRGRPVREPRPGAEHGWITGELIGRLHTHVRDDRRGLVVTETGFLLTAEPPTVRGPDIAYIAARNLPAGGIPIGFWRVAPDLAVEVVSPSNAATEIQEKVLEYLVAGTRLVWVVDPRTRSVTVYRSRDQVRVLTGGDELDGADVLPGFRLVIGDLFAPPGGFGGAEE